MDTSKVFYCYSINLLRHLKAHQIDFIARGINQRTQREYWCYLKTDELSKALTLWSTSKTDSVTEV